MVAVESRDIAALKHTRNLVCPLLEGGLVLQVLVRDTMHVDGLLGNHLLRVEAVSAALLLTAREHLDVGQFDDAVLGDVQSCGFQVKDHERAFQVQFHVVLDN